MNVALRHVLFVTDAFHPETGGVERVCFELAKALLRKNLRVTVLARAAAGRPDHEAIEGIRVFRYRHLRRFAPLVYFSHWFSSRSAAARILRGDPPDIAHCHLALSAQGPLGVFRRSGLPVAASFYGPWHEEFSVEAGELLAASGPIYRRYLGLQTRIQKRLQRRLIRMAHGVVVLSDFSRTELLKLAPEAGSKIAKIPGGVDSGLFFPPNEKRERIGPPVLFTARRLVHRTGVDLLLDALGLLAARGIKAKLIIAGQGPLLPSLESKARAVGSADSVRFAGFVGDEALAEHYRNADVFVLPTRAQENFGLPILEAAACGCPVVATPVGSIPELMDAVDSPYLCEDASAAALATTIERALREITGGLSGRTENAERVAARYSWDEIADEHIEHYRRILSCASR